MSYLTKYGSFWGQLPVTSGKYIWVAPSASYVVEGQTYPASDGNDGLSPERAVATVDYAVGLCSANVGDVIILLPGAHTSAATVTVDVAGILITGIPGSEPTNSIRSSAGSRRNKSRITCTDTAGIIFTVTAADVEIAWLSLEPAAAGGRGVSISGGGDRCYIHDCTVLMVDTASTTTYGITFPTSTGTPVADDVLIRRCYFQSGTATTTGANGPAVNVLGTAVNLTVEACTFALKGTAAWADAILSSNPGSLGLQVNDCDFLSPTVTTTVITNGINATSVIVNGATVARRCYFMEGTDAFVATATLDIVAAECYIANSTGSVLAASS